MLLSDFETTYLRISEDIQHIGCSTTDGNGVDIAKCTAILEKRWLMIGANVRTGVPDC